MKKYFLVVIILIMLFATACTSSKADEASKNLSTQADNFQVNRRIVFYNGITDTYMLVISGYCSLGNYDPAGSLSVTCKTGVNEYKKYFLGLSNNVTYIVEQLDPQAVNVYHTEVIFRPETILPSIKLDTSNNSVP